MKMAGLKTCKTCGVPLRVGKGHVWNSDGTITQRRDPDHRMLFFDSDSLDSLFSNIEKLIGVPIEKIVIESKARATRTYISHMIRGAKGQIARIVGLERIVTRVVEQGKVMGYGDIKVLEFNWKENYMECEIGNPYSLALFCGDLRGANEAIRIVVGTVTYEEIGPDRYLIKNFEAPHAPELEDRLLPTAKPRKPGNIEFNRCPGCGAPLEISRFKWDLERGIITHDDTGMRMALFGPTGLEVIFEELERELGDTIPDAIVEAQRMHAERSMRPRWKVAQPQDIRNWLAIQGLGNLAELEPVGESGFTVRIENPALPLIIVGTAKGFYEFMTDRKGSVSWELTDDGDLKMSFAPAG